MSATQRARAATQPNELPTAAWWRNFRDPQLNSLIERATRGNLDLRAAEARLRQARAQYGVTRADFFPTVNGKRRVYFHNRTSANGRGAGVGTSTGTTTTGGTGTGSGGTTTGVSGSGPSLESDLELAGFDSTWEIDIFRWQGPPRGRIGR